MSNAPPNGYTVRLVYYGPADLVKRKYHWEDDKESHTGEPQTPQAATQNIRIVAFPASDEGWDYIGVYELVKNGEAKE